MSKQPKCTMDFLLHYVQRVDTLKPNVRHRDGSLFRCPCGILYPTLVRTNPVVGTPAQAFVNVLVNALVRHYWLVFGRLAISVNERSKLPREKLSASVLDSVDDMCGWIKRVRILVETNRVELNNGVSLSSEPILGLLTARVA